MTGEPDPDEEIRLVLGDANGTTWKSWTFTRGQIVKDAGTITVADLLAAADDDNRWAER